MHQSQESWKFSMNDAHHPLCRDPLRTSRPWPQSTATRCFEQLISVLPSRRPVSKLVPPSALHITDAAPNVTDRPFGVCPIEETLHRGHQWIPYARWLSTVRQSRERLISGLAHCLGSSFGFWARRHSHRRRRRRRRRSCSSFSFSFWSCRQARATPAPPGFPTPLRKFALTP